MSAKFGKIQVQERFDRTDTLRIEIFHTYLLEMLPIHVSKNNTISIKLAL